jgi:hypothetical protein
MRRIALRVIFGILALADLLGAWSLVIGIQATLEPGRGEGWWFVVAVLAVLWVAAVTLTWHVARRAWPSFANRFAKPS